MPIINENANMTKCDIHIAPDKTLIDTDDGLTQICPNNITIEFWHPDGSYHKSVPLSEVIEAYTA